MSANVCDSLVALVRRHAALTIESLEATECKSPGRSVITRLSLCDKALRCRYVAASKERHLGTDAMSSPRAPRRNATRWTVKRACEEKVVE